jgi:hypothetical protein
MTKPKPFAAYIDVAPDWWDSSLDDYLERPATAFLKQAVHIGDAVNQCRRRFQRKGDTSFNKDSQDSIYRLGAAALSSLMSHFETFERSLFAGLLEATRFIPTFDVSDCCKKLQRDSSLAVDLTRLVAYRGRPAPIGQLLADNLAAWHSPETVNSHFRAVVSDFQFFSKADSEELLVLWQLRHSAVHTGGWLTHADAQKHSALAALADRAILLNENFVEAVARRLHQIVKRSTGGIGTKFKAKLPPGLSVKDRKGVDLLFEVKSPRMSWLK